MKVENPSNYSSDKSSSSRAEGREGYFVLENAKGETVRSFRWQDTQIVVVYRHDTRRIATVASTKELEEAGIEFDILTETTQAKLKKSPVEFENKGRLKWVPQIVSFSREFDLNPENTLEPKKALGWSAALQLGLASIIIVAGYFSGTRVEKPHDVTVTLLSQDAVQKILEQEQPPPKVEQAATPVEPKRVRRRAQDPRQIVVAPSAHKLAKHAPIPTHSTSFKKTAQVKSKGLRGGGYAGNARRGYGTNEQYMNEIGALGALNAKHVRGGNGGSGGLNLRAVGTEDGSGAGGKGYGGFGSNGSGGHGLGGLGKGHGMGLENSMYGKGLIAAPFGEGSPAPGVGGYGTRGRAGGGARGAGYGTTTVVGSWKGTGPKGFGSAGSGAGNGDPNGSPYGSADGDDDDAIVTGGLDQAQILEVINRNKGQIAYCYEQGLQTQPHLTGRVEVRFRIAGTGHVSLAEVRYSSVHSAQVEGCIVKKIHTWIFPHPQGGVSVAVTKPFNLSRTLSMR